MNVVIYIEDGVYPLDFAIPCELLSEVGANVSVVTARPAAVKLSTGLSVEPLTALDSVSNVDLLWVCSAMSVTGIAAEALNKLAELAAQATYLVAVGNAVNALIDAAAITESDVAVSYKSHKKYKKSAVAPSHEMVVSDKNLLTISSHGEILTATLTLLESIYGYSTMTDIAAKHSIKLFSKCALDARTLKKNAKENDKRIAEYGKGKRDAGEAVLYAFDGMRAIDYLAIDAIASQMGYRCHYIADRRGSIKTLRGAYDIVVDDAIQNHRQSELLIIPSGKIDPHMVDQYLIHWLTAICPVSHRVLTVGNAEQLLGVTELLREIDPDVLANLKLGEGKYLMPQHFIDAVRTLFTIAAERDKKLEKRINNFFGFGLTGTIDFS